MPEQQATAKETAREARRLEERGNNMSVRAEQRHQASKQAEALRAGQGA